MADAGNPVLDSEDWEVVFQAYGEYPVLAFILAQHFNYLKELIEHGRGVEASAGIDCAIERLMKRTSFRDSGRRMYLLAVAGKLKPERTLKDLSV